MGVSLWLGELMSPYAAATEVPCWFRICLIMNFLYVAEINKVYKRKLYYIILYHLEQCNTISMGFIL